MNSGVTIIPYNTRLGTSEKNRRLSSTPIQAGKKSNFKLFYVERIRRNERMKSSSQMPYRSQ